MLGIEIFTAQDQLHVLGAFVVFLELLSKSFDDYFWMILIGGSNQKNDCDKNERIHE